MALPFSVGERVSERLNFPPPRRIENASHFLHEDAGEEVGAVIAEWLASSGPVHNEPVPVEAR
jgi:hypothetical protein